MNKIWATLPQGATGFVIYYHYNGKQHTLNGNGGYATGPIQTSRPKKQCIECGHPFIPARKDARYCGRKCIDTAYRRRRETTPTPTPRTGGLFG